MASQRERFLEELRYVRDGLRELAKEKRGARQKTADLASVENVQKGIRKAVAQARSANYRAFLLRRLQGLKNGTLPLTVSDYFQFWTDLHDKDEIVWFKGTSYLTPSLWNEPEMKLYQERQIRQLEAVGRRVRDEEFFSKKIEGIDARLARILQECQNGYEKTHTSESVIEARCSDALEERYERVFIIAANAGSERLSSSDPRGAALASVIGTQASRGIAVKVICLRLNESSTFERPQDFGIVFTSEGDAFGMFCDVDTVGNPQGGMVIRDEKGIAHYFDCFLRIRGRALAIPRTATPQETADIIEVCTSNPVDISDSTLYGNRCLHCLRTAESVASGRARRADEGGLETWYEVFRSENEALADFFSSWHPTGSVLEIGCGPGRVLRLMLELQRKSDLGTATRIVGYEQNGDIANACVEAFRPYNSVDIFVRYVGFMPDGRMKSILDEHRHQFGLILAMSNLIGWQENREVEWLASVVAEGLSAQGTLFATVYKKGKELERARMYKAAGDLVEIGPTGDIVLVTDAFNGERHRSKSYDEPDLVAILEQVEERVKDKAVISYSIADVGEFMWSVKICREDKGGRTARRRA